MNDQLHWLFVISLLFLGIAVVAVIPQTVLTPQ